MIGCDCELVVFRGEAQMLMGILLQERKALEAKLAVANERAKKSEVRLFKRIVQYLFLLILLNFL